MKGFGGLPVDAVCAVFQHCVGHTAAHTGAACHEAQALGQLIGQQVGQDHLAAITLPAVHRVHRHGGLGTGAHQRRRKALVYGQFGRRSHGHAAHVVGVCCAACAAARADQVHEGFPACALGGADHDQQVGSAIGGQVHTAHRRLVGIHDTVVIQVAVYGQHGRKGAGCFYAAHHTQGRCRVSGIHDGVLEGGVFSGQQRGALAGSRDRTVGRDADGAHGLHRGADQVALSVCGTARHQWIKRPGCNVGDVGSGRSTGGAGPLAARTGTQRQQRRHQLQWGFRYVAHGHGLLVVKGKRSLGTAKVGFKEDL